MQTKSDAYTHKSNFNLGVSKFIKYQSLSRLYVWFIFDIINIINLILAISMHIKCSKRLNFKR